MTVRSVWLGLISIGIAFSAIAWVLPQLTGTYVKVVVGLQLVIATPLVVRYLADRIDLSGRAYRLYKLWFLLLIPVYFALGTVVPADAVASARVFAVGFVVSLIVAVIVVARDVDEALWRFVDDRSP